MRQLRLEVVGVSEQELHEHETYLKYFDGKSSVIFDGRNSYFYIERDDNEIRQESVRYACLNQNVEGVFMKLKKDCRWGKAGEVVELNP